MNLGGILQHKMFDVVIVIIFFFYQLVLLGSFVNHSYDYRLKVLKVRFGTKNGKIVN